MKKLLFVLLFIPGILLSQTDSDITGRLGSTLTEGGLDSIVTFYSAGKEWVEIFLVDSATTNDTCVVEVLNPINDNWTVIGMKDQSQETFVDTLIPGVNVNGKLYIIWMMYPRSFRIRKTDTGQLSENISYAIQTKGDGK